MDGTVGGSVEGRAFTGPKYRSAAAIDGGGRCGPLSGQADEGESSPFCYGRDRPPRRGRASSRSPSTEDSSFVLATRETLGHSGEVTIDAINNSSDERFTQAPSGFPLRR